MQEEQLIVIRFTEDHATTIRESLRKLLAGMIDGEMFNSRDAKLNAKILKLLNDRASIALRSVEECIPF